MNDNLAQNARTAKLRLQQVVALLAASEPEYGEED